MARADDPTGRPDVPMAVVVADGDVDTSALRALLGTTPDAVVIAADGGAGKVLAAGRTPHRVIGDGDSIEPGVRARLEALGVPMRIAAIDKDESDTELALLAALEQGARSIVVLGALGGSRPEHSIANLLLLADARFDDVDLALLAGGSRIRRLGSSEGPGSLDLLGQAGDFVSLLPLGSDVLGVRTEGLRFALDGETLRLGPARGLSNELLGQRARVTTSRGRLLVVHTPRAAGGGRGDGGPEEGGHEEGGHEA